MKLIRAVFKNFRLLQDVVFDFSVDKEKKLTVIRAANESGKTTAETALIWCLYGSEVIDPKNQYPLHPAQEKNKGIKEFKISVEVEFETEEIVEKKGITAVFKQRYKLVRTCVEKIDPSNINIFKRVHESIDMYQCSDGGESRVLDTQAKLVIERALPNNLRSIYFTDGDSAMSFIDSSAAQQQKKTRVRSAIESLLALNNLNELHRILNSIVIDFSKQIDKNNYGQLLAEAETECQQCQDWLSENEEEIKMLDQEIESFEKDLLKKRKEIDDLISLGDKEKIVRDLARLTADKTRERNSSDTALKLLCSSVANDKFAAAMLAGNVDFANNALLKMKEEKRLPRQSIPVLEELLEREMCVCGLPLDPTSHDCASRIKTINDTITNSQNSDKLQRRATELMYSIKSIDFNSSAKAWIDEYASNFTLYGNSSSAINHISEQIKEKEKEKDLIDDSTIKELRLLEASIRANIKKKSEELGGLNKETEIKTSRMKDLKRDIDLYSKKKTKDDTSSDNYNLASSVRTIFEEVLSRIKEQEIKKVSFEMNRIFLKMIGASSADPEFYFIESAELTDDFEIRVYGKGRHLLDPDKDLNGASRRAITLAFILALTKVSKVEATNVIDTPLGMMSGYVKRAVLESLISEGSQIVLFLTHSEILGVEDIIDKYAGKVFTLTNPAHYPTQLKYRPTADSVHIIRCDCSHRVVCSVCERNYV
ncbi:AAA family ATPase [Aeromonas veronii]|uniref:AAA family ATPase n=1 Tax=Aeromonas TaxID=642 RepID=UPI0018F1C98E|nr:AAA family ATPase [Aeromonas veronii]MBJ7583850.1 AAA family ATPase [Aeromonas veronii]MBL0452117.1 AAA family ATPase [Aeromonas veronii]MEB5667500.1 AAA family ATPase [Aeromonas veronii]HDX8427750.1 AAA family ATPase [Aeromonas veronii]